jgi:hypothetical protein
VTDQQKAKYPIQGNIAVVPIEFLPFFEEDEVNAAMEYLSHPSGAVNPFFRDFAKIASAVHGEIPNPINWDTYTLEDGFQAGDDKRPRYMHIDLAINNDGAGVTMCHCDGWKGVHTRNEVGAFEEVLLPQVKWDLAAVLRPRQSYGEREINYDAIMELIFDLHGRNFNLMGGLITFDRFQSHHMKTTLTTFGFNVAILSIDHTPHKILVDYTKPDRVRKEPIPRQPAAAMMALRDCCYQDRAVLCQLPEHPDMPGITWLEKEARECQADTSNAQKLVKAVKVDGGSDDLLQAAAGACFNCVNNALPDELSEMDPAGQATEQSFYSQFGMGTKGNRIPDEVIENGDYVNPRLQQQGDPFYVNLDRHRLGIDHLV